MIIFHGGCHGCTQQELHGQDFCYDCQYFDAKWDKPNLNNRPPTDAEIEREKIKEKHKLKEEKEKNNKGTEILEKF